MPYGTLASDVIQSSAVRTPPQFADANGTQIGTLCRAFVNWSTTGTIVKSFNVSSVTQNTTGYFTINFTNAMPDANYVWTSTYTSPGSGTPVAAENNTYTSKSTSAIGIQQGYTYSGGYVLYSSFPYNGLTFFA